MEILLYNHWPTQVWFLPGPQEMLVESVTGDMLDKLISHEEEKDEFVWLWWHRDTLKYLEIWISSFCLI